MGEKPYLPYESEEETGLAESSMTELQKQLSEARESKFHEPSKMLFDRRSGTLLFAVGKEKVDSPALRGAAKEEGFKEKEELHITVAGFGPGKEIVKKIKSLSSGEQKEAWEQIDDLISKIDWRFSLEFQEGRRLEKTYGGGGQPEKRQSYIQHVVVAGLDKFYAGLNTILGTSLEVPPAHVTLYLKN